MLRRGRWRRRPRTGRLSPALSTGCVPSALRSARAAASSGKTAATCATAVPPRSSRPRVNENMCAYVCTCLEVLWTVYMPEVMHTHTYIHLVVCKIQRLALIYANSLLTSRVTCSIVATFCTLDLPAARSATRVQTKRPSSATRYNGSQLREVAFRGWRCALRKKLAVRLAQERRLALSSAWRFDCMSVWAAAR